jgi:hypothetical protein
MDDSHFGYITKFTKEKNCLADGILKVVKGKSSKF